MQVLFDPLLSLRDGKPTYAKNKLSHSKFAYNVGFTTLLITSRNIRRICLYNDEIVNAWGLVTFRKIVEGAYYSGGCSTVAVSTKGEVQNGEFVYLYNQT